MATKVIYFTVSNRPEQAEFLLDATSDEIKDCFRSAAEAGPYDILKLYNDNGNLINISASIQQNSSCNPYKLEVVAAHCGHCGKDFHGLDIESVDNRLQMLEKRILLEEGILPIELNELKKKVDSFKEKLESVEHLSWLGLFKEMSIGPSALPYSNLDKTAKLRRTQSEYEEVLNKFLKMGSGLTSEETLEKLRRPSFDNWQWEDAEMMFLVQQMFLDLGLVETFHIDMSTLQQFIFAVYKHYNLVPYHNFRHCFCVTQMMYGMICLSEVQHMIPPYEVLILIVAAFCHDLDHPGHNNSYQVNARKELAIRYNDISPLENHHAAVAFDILSQPHCNIFSNVKPELYKKIRAGIISLILATDMALHNELLKEFKLIIENGFDWLSEDHRKSMLKTFIKAADVSNETRPMDIAEPWLECLLQEFFNQSDLEKLEGLPTSAFMDRDKVTKSSAQIGFIKFILIPLYEAMAELFPIFEDYLLKPIKKAFDYYVEMGQKMELDKQKEQEKYSTKFSADYERQLNSEMNRKLSLEFDKRLTEEIQKKFNEERERRASTGSRGESGGSSRKSSKVNELYDKFVSEPDEIAHLSSVDVLDSLETNLTVCKQTSTDIEKTFCLNCS
ncbi:high affinity cGMP-specific 3',5'-cyclic phosphodiesterase 9A isoform X3 [Hydra vulgaris]|uniref:Phosphodiesterase n=2 Tax=Hydra vulgaris TaxID=6087 RepID=A0ABM4C186_HYDVU